MAGLDERIAAMERARRILEQERVVTEQAAKQNTPVWTLNDMRLGIRSGTICFENKKELIFDTKYLFKEQIPMIWIKEFYTNIQETEEMVVNTNPVEQVGQVILRLPEESREDFSVVADRLKSGMLEQGLYANILRIESLPNIEYLIYTTPTKEGWIYNLLFRIKQYQQRIMGTYNCLEKDKDTYGLLLEALLFELQDQL